MQKQFSKLFLLSFVLFSLAISSCNKEDDSCSDPALKDNIVGNWKVTPSNSIVEFKSDGTMVDTDDALVGGEVNGTVLDEKTYAVVGDNGLNLKAEKGSQFIELELTATSNECDKIILSVPALGISVTLERQ